ncbi:uncharacterized protein LODBEIA_P22260 [Lodderomyces beijingensis]|uniref:UPF3 domain-containing protein n=1 Tax=Lodderomyces beijingensis TaxID=1775926 RepID=A0ABP0ZKU4_9ASCO
MASVTPSRNPPLKPPQSRGSSSRRAPLASGAGKPGSNKTSLLDAGSRSNKLTIRLLPPSLGEREFLAQLAQIYPYHATKIMQFYYVQGSYPSKPFEVPVYSRAYVAFKNVTDMEAFANFVKGKSFADDRDSTVPMVERSLFHKMVDLRSQSFSEDAGDKGKNDPKWSLSEDEIFKKFLSFLNNETPEFNLVKAKKQVRKRKEKAPAAEAKNKKAKGNEPKAKEAKKEENETNGKKKEKKEKKEKENAKGNKSGKRRSRKPHEPTKPSEGEPGSETKEATANKKKRPKKEAKQSGKTETTDADISNNNNNNNASTEKSTPTKRTRTKKRPPKKNKPAGSSEGNSKPPAPSEGPVPIESQRPKQAPAAPIKPIKILTSKNDKSTNTNTADTG